MPFYLSILAGSSAFIAPLNKGSRDYLPFRGLRALASSTATPLSLAMKQADPRRFYNDLARAGLNSAESMYTHHHLQLATPLSTTSSVSMPIPSALRPPEEDLATVLDALATEGSDIKADERVIPVPGQVEQATRKSWGRAGLRLSPFDLQQGIVRV